MGEVQQPLEKGDDSINPTCQTAFQLLKVIQPLLTMLAAKKEKLIPARDVIDAIQEALRKHVEPDQGDEILEAISKEVIKLQPKLRTPEELDQLLDSIVEKIGEMVDGISRQCPGA